ncbi:hypothetical protein [Bradyrhizobium erythrophlei]|uniref:Uncharacterized protein n=1 Tax=Bradyrhizobium erythrophlei TaxID=1437360 RepID=A0A1M5H572_9BRAD|nr:hypothetical protein [Bradyrhizobium erythrophlei]SHG11161.1 hypothetical protein SAMN05443248_0324 [Bradyrhizobium erythrophlei]
MTSRHMQSARELQQLDNWSVNPEIRIAYVSKGSSRFTGSVWLGASLRRRGSSATTKLGTFMDDAEAGVLAFMSAGSKFVGHVVVLTFKFVLRTDRVRTSKKQVCEKWTNGRLLRIPEFP